MLLLLLLLLSLNSSIKSASTTLSVDIVTVAPKNILCLIAEQKSSYRMECMLASLRMSAYTSPQMGFPSCAVAYAVVCQSQKSCCSARSCLITHNPDCISAVVHLNDRIAWCAAYSIATTLSESPVAACKVFSIAI